MFKLSGNLKVLAVIFVVLGAIGIIYGFVATPSSTDEAKEIAKTHYQDQQEENELVDKIHESGFTEKAMEAQENSMEAEGAVDKVMHQLQARPWAAVFTAAFFFFMMALGVLVFHAVQYVSESGWSPVLYRVFQGITSYVLPGSIIVALIVLFAGTHFYPWLNKEYVEGDSDMLIKAGYLNLPFFIIRLAIYLAIWNVYRYLERKNSIAQIDASDYAPHRRNYRYSVIFIILFAASESTMAWDWFMSMTPHWFSALYAWYVFASIFVSGITATALITIFLKKRGYLKFVKDSHLHDLAKYIFAFSIFWTYLWFAQFMLIWYANIPEEASYFVMQIQHYKVLFFGMLLLNFVFPIVILMNSDFKRIPWIVEFVGIFVLIGHYIAIYLLVIPNTVGVFGTFGFAELGGILFFLGLFILVVGTALGKRPLQMESDPYLKESRNFEY